MTEIPFEFWEQQTVEHQAWLAVVSELRRLGVGQMEDGEPHERLHDLITAWAEELVELRRLDPDPDHAANALAQRRSKIDHWNEVT